MLTLTIDGHAFTLDAKEAEFLAGCLHAGLSHRGHRFERTHNGSHGAFRVSAGETVHTLPSGVATFNARSKANGQQAQASTAQALRLADGTEVKLSGVSPHAIERDNKREAAVAARIAKRSGAPTLTDC